MCCSQLVYILIMTCLWVFLDLLLNPRQQTWKKLQACKRCLRTIFEKVVDIFGWTMNFCPFLPIKGHQFALFTYIKSILVKKISNVLEKIEIQVTFVWLGDTWICGPVSIQKIGLRTKINFFHVCSPGGGGGSYWSSLGAMFCPLHEMLTNINNKGSISYR